MANRLWVVYQPVRFNDRCYRSAAALAPKPLACGRRAVQPEQRVVLAGAACDGHVRRWRGATSCYLNGSIG